MDTKSRNTNGGLDQHRMRGLSSRYCVPALAPAQDAGPICHSALLPFPIRKVVCVNSSLSGHRKIIVTLNWSQWWPGTTSPAHSAMDIQSQLVPLGFQGHLAIISSSQNRIHSGRNLRFATTLIDTPISFGCSPSPQRNGTSRRTTTLKHWSNGLTMQPSNTGTHSERLLCDRLNTGDSDHIAPQCPSLPLVS